MSAVRVVHIPWQLWFLACSGGLLVIGLGVSFAALPRVLGWPLLGGLLVGVLLARFLWPSLFPMLVYGAQPGIVLLTLIFAAQWLLRERYRRQLVFMPGFTRLKPGSSLIHPGSSNRKREISTVDEPAKRGSSLSGEPKA